MQQLYHQTDTFLHVMFMSWSLRDTCSEFHAWFISPLFTWDRKTQWDMGFSAVINNMVNFTSPVSNKSEPQGFSVNMKPHFIFSLILLFWLSQILVPPTYRIWGYKNIPSFWRLARLSAAVKGPRHFTLQRYQRTKQETKASPRVQKPPDEVDKDFCMKLCRIWQRMLLSLSYYNTVWKWFPCHLRKPEMSKEVCIEREGGKREAVSGLSASGKDEESQEPW